MNVLEVALVPRAREPTRNCGWSVILYRNNWTFYSCSRSDIDLKRATDLITTIISSTANYVWKYSPSQARLFRVWMFKRTGLTAQPETRHEFGPTRTWHAVNRPVSARPGPVTRPCIGRRRGTTG
jgi:hypothetical protein